MNDLTIYIPTYKRSGKVSTIKYLGKSAMHMVNLVTRHDEAEAYKAAYPGINVLPLPESTTNLSQTRQWIMDNCPTRFLMQLDDDLDLHKRPDRKDYHLRPLVEDQFSEMLEEMRAFMDQNEIVHCAVSAREGNNRNPEDWRFNQRYMRAYIFDLDVVRKFKYSEPCCGTEDFHMALQLLTAGYRSAVMFCYAQGQGTSNAKGGLSTYRTIEYHNNAMAKLQEAFPKYVKLRNVKTKTAWQGMERVDATVKWKEAYKNSPKIVGAECPPAERLHP